MQPGDDPVSVGVRVEPGAEFGWREVVVEVSISPGYHLYAEPVPEGFVALSITVETGDDLVAGSPVWPPAERLVMEDIPDEFWVYHGTIAGRLPVRLPDGAGSPTLEGEVSYQACTDFTCYLPASIGFSVPLA